MKDNNRNAIPFSHNKYNSLFDELFEPLCQYSFQVTQEVEVSEDIVQERFIYLWNNWERLSNFENLKAYLYQSVKSRSINYIKKKFNTNINSLEGMADSIENCQLPSPIELLEKADLETILEEALNTLPEKCRIIFDLKRNAELSNKEISEQLNLSIKTVEAQTTIALKKIRLHINKHWVAIVHVGFLLFI